jgi:hypothetical protein
MALANDVVFTLYSGEIVVENHQRRGFASNIGAAPIAMPMWAALSAGASFTPSPVMATTSGAALPFIDLPQDRTIRDYLASFLEPDHSP